MTGPFDLTERIKNLSPVELASTMRRVLQLEAARLNLPYGSSRASQRVTVGDGGEDGLILGIPAGAPTLLPAGDSLLQFKTVQDLATAKTQILKELRESPRPREILEKGGNYIAVWSKDAVGLEADELRSAMQEEVGGERVDQVHVWSIGAIEEICSTNPATLIELGLVGGLGVLPFHLWAPGQVRDVANYVPDETRAGMIDQIRAAVLEGTDSRIVHVQGDAGVGKTRLLKEALDFDDIRDQVVVGDAASVGEFIRYVIALPNAHCILFADEVDAPDIDSLYKAIQPAQGRIRLITAGLPGTHRSARPTGNDIELGPLSGDALVQLVSQEVGLPDAEARWVANVSDGYPRLAIEAARFVKTDPAAATIGAAITSLGIAQLLDRMLTGEALQRHLGIAALFSAIGVEGGREEELIAVAEAFEVDHALLRQTLSDEAGRFVSRAGSLRSVTPRLVAIWLASLLLRERGTQVAKSISALPEPLPERFRDQLVYLRQAPAIKDIVHELLREELPGVVDFDEAAAGFLRAAAAVDPEQVAGRLTAIMDGLTDDQLRADSFPRRNVVWTLEQLLWPPETYEIASSLLLRLAVNENESFGNNATGVLVDSFQTHLGGTEVPYPDRLAWFDQQAEAGLTGRRRKVLAACAAAGLRDHQTRMHGTRPDETGITDWRPTTWDEQRDAHLGAWERLVELVDGADADQRPEIFRFLCGAMRQALAGGIGDAVLETVLERNWTPAERSELAPPLRAVLKYDNPPEKWREQISQVVEQLEGQSFDERIAAALHTAIWDLQEEEYADVPRALRELAEAAAPDEARVASALHITATLEDQNTAYAFWREVARLGDPKQLAEKALRHDPPVLAAYQAALGAGGERDREWVDQQLVESRDDAARAARLVQLIQASGADDARVSLLLDAVEEGEIPLEQLAQLLYGATVRELGPDVAIRLIRLAATSDTPTVLEHALGMLHQYQDVQDDLLGEAEVADLAVELAIKSLGQDGAGDMASHYAYELAKRLPVDQALRILEARITGALSLPDPPEMDLLRRAFAEQPEQTANWVFDLLTRSVSPPYQRWAIWAERFGLLTQAATAVGGEAVWDWFRSQPEEAQIFLVRHIDFGLAEPDELLKHLLNSTSDEHLRIETSVAFSNSLGVVSGPYHLGLKRQVERLRSWRAHLDGRARNWVDEQIKSFEKQVDVQRHRDAEDEALRS